MAIWHIHAWSNWKTDQAFIGEYVHGGGLARVEIQRRQCSKCGKVELNRQVA